MQGNGGGERGKGQVLSMCRGAEAGRNVGYTGITPHAIIRPSLDGLIRGVTGPSTVPSSCLLKLKARRDGPVPYLRQPVYPYIRTRCSALNIAFLCTTNTSPPFEPDAHKVCSRAKYHYDPQLGQQLSLSGIVTGTADSAGAASSVSSGNEFRKSSGFRHAHKRMARTMYFCWATGLLKLPFGGPPAHGQYSLLMHRKFPLLSDPLSATTRYHM